MTRFPGHPIEFRHLEDSAEPGQPARKRLWFRLAGELPDDPALHRYLLAYSSDFNLLTTSLVPHDLVFGDPRLQIASLDHACGSTTTSRSTTGCSMTWTAPGLAARAASPVAASTIVTDAWSLPVPRKD
ncbi:acyl-CoA thioesterase 2 [Halomonas elongata]|uniref:Acyl-CoA thioesterase 2 n=1 Tax=Halomonas elongata TaxID=2746 RepID=A0A1B8P5U0_HALEL|nr:acyl-CoA thioesterase 2 [Halomonas elongata]